MNISLKYIQNIDILIIFKRLSFLLLVLLFTLFSFFLVNRKPVQASTTRHNEYAESTAESTWNTNTTYQDKVTLTFTPEANSTYVIIASWIMKSGTATYQVKGKLTRTTGTPKDFNELLYAPKDVLDYTSGGTIGFDTFGASPSSQTYKIQYGTSNTAATAYIKEAKIIAIKLTNKDQYAEAETRTTTQQTAYQDKTTLTFTPDSTDDYIIIASATTDGIITSYDHRTQLNIDGTAYSNSIIETNVVANRYLWATVKRVSLDNSEHTIKIQYSTESNNSARLAGIANARIVALRADEFINNYFSESEARATTTSTSYQTKTTLTATPQAYNHLVIGTSGLDISSTSYSVFGQLLKGSTSFGEMRRETSDATSRGFSYFGIKRETLTNTSTSWYLQYRSSSTSRTAGIANARISLIELRQPSITVSTTGTQVTQVNNSTSNVYIGGAFVFVRESGSNTVQSIRVSQTGTIADSNISGLILYYKQEATCSTSIPGDATVFNSTPGTFSSGSSTVTGTMNVGTSQVCIYTEVDIGSGASGGNTIEIQITNPSTGVIVAAGSVEPGSAVAISGTTTIVVNTAPNFTVYSNNGPVNPGATVTFSTTASDPDGNNITLVVCKTQGVTGTACDGGAGDTWCTSSSVVSNPSCGYSVPSVFPDGAYNTYPYIFDSLGLGSGSSLQGTLATFTVNNVTPTVSAVTINGGVAISLESGTTKSVTLTVTVSDNNSCYGTEISSVLGYVYRSGVTYTGCDSVGEANSNYCYPEVECSIVGGSCTDETDASANYTCTANIYYYADPTGTNTQYPSDTWMNTMKAIDNNSATDALQVSVGVKMNMLESMSITSSINYGTLSVQSGNDPLDRTTTSTPTGNVGLDHEIYGTDMCTDYPGCAASKIIVTYQKYALTASTPYSSATQLTTTPTPVSIDISKPTTGSPTAKSMWWGMYAPLNTSPGSYTGTINVTAFASDPLNW